MFDVWFELTSDGPEVTDLRIAFWCVARSTGRMYYICRVYSWADAIDVAVRYLGPSALNVSSWTVKPVPHL